MSEPTLCNLTFNPSGQSTILFIHGAFSSPDEWSYVSPHLPSYHLLIPSLPSHGSNLSIRPFTLPFSARLLANLIKTDAKNGKAHIVGLSIGAHVALYLAAHHPDVVLTVFASGINRFSPSIWMPVLPYILYCTQHFIDFVVPKRLVTYLMDGTPGLHKENAHAACTLQLCREVIAILVTDEEIPPVQARTLVVAATKRGFLPTNDSVKDAKMVRECVKKGNLESKAAEVYRRHPWDLQDPQLFAKSVIAWIEGTILPEDLKVL
jgi:pimeloyl-ACP methyl ester carboxylesterase